MNFALQLFQTIIITSAVIIAVWLINNRQMEVLLLFRQTAKEEEINAALSLIEIMGMGPVLNDANKANIQTNISYAASQNAPEISQINFIIYIRTI